VFHIWRKINDSKIKNGVAWPTVPFIPMLLAWSEMIQLMLRKVLLLQNHSHQQSCHHQ